MASSRSNIAVSVYGATRELGLPAYKLGGQVRASRAELDKWVRERRRVVVGNEPLIIYLTKIVIYTIKYA